MRSALKSMSTRSRWRSSECFTKLSEYEYFLIFFYYCQLTLMRNVANYCKLAAIFSLFEIRENQIFNLSTISPSIRCLLMISSRSSSACIAVPHSIRIHDSHRSLGAAVQTTRLINTNTPLARDTKLFGSAFGIAAKFRSPMVLAATFILALIYTHK